MKKAIIVIVLLILLSRQPTLAQVGSTNRNRIQEQVQLQQTTTSQISPTATKEGALQAQTRTTIRLQKLNNLRERLETKKQTIRQNLQQKKEQIRERLSEIRKTRIRNFFGRLITRMEKRVERIGKLITRIESRIAKIKEAEPDIDTSSIEKELNDAKAKLEEVGTAIADAKASLEDILSSEDPKEAFSSVKNLIKEIKTSLIKIHRQLVNIIGDIKGLRVGTTKTPKPALLGPPVATQEGE